MDIPSFIFGFAVGGMLMSWISGLLMNRLQRESTKMWRETIEKINNGWSETCRSIRGGRHG